MKQLFQESKLFSSGIILYILSFLFFCIFFGSVFILTEQFSDIQISRILENNTLFLLLLATCFFFGFLTFTTGTICLSQFLASYGFAKPVIFKQKILWWFRFIGILCIFPLYSLIKLLLSIKGKPLQNKLLSIVSSLFIFVIFLPVWTIYSFFLIASTTYIAGSSIGVAPVIENISGT